MIKVLKTGFDKVKGPGRTTWYMYMWLGCKYSSTHKANDGGDMKYTIFHHFPAPHDGYPENMYYRPY